MGEKKLTSRRDFLRAGMLGAAGAVLAACQGETVEVTREVEKIVKETVLQTVVEKETVMQTVVETVVEKETVMVEGEKVEVTKIVEVEKEVPVEVEKVVTATPSETMAMAEVQGTFWVLQKQDFHPDFNAWFRANMVTWAKQNDWPLDISYMAGYTGGTPELEKIIASVAAGTQADLLMHNLGIAQLRQAYALEAVTPIVETVEEQWGKTAQRNVNDYVADEQWWAVPYYQRSDGGWFQRPVWQDAGYDIHSIRQYPELWEACLDVSNPDESLYGWGVTINTGGDGDWFRHRVKHGWGAYVQDETGDFVTFDSPEMVEAMTAMTSIYMDDEWAPMLPPGVLAWGDSQNNEAYLAGLLAYTQNGGTVYAKAVLDDNPIKDITGFHAPVGGPVNQEFNSLGSNNFMILRGARNYDAARATILEIMLKLENQDATFAASPAFSLPAYERLWDESEYIKTDLVAQEQRPVAMDPNGVIAGTYPGPSQNPAMAAKDAALIENDMVADILRGTPVAEAVTTAHDRMVAIWKEFGLPGEA